MREEIRHRTERVREGTQAWIRTMLSKQRRAVSVAFGVTIIVLLVLIAALPRISRASDGNLLSNGGFEHGFAAVAGCGDVGAQWRCFTNGGAANYGFYEDQWEAVVAEGKHSQLIEINTKGLAAGDNDRYAGISQTVRVVPGAKYKFSLRGIIRTTNQAGDPWRYSVQVGFLDGPNADWRDVENWSDVGWNTYYERDEPGGVSGFITNLVPDSEVITVFVRVWKKWGVAGEELDVNLDSIELTGPSAALPKADGMVPGPALPMTGIGGPVGDGPHPQGSDNQGPSYQGPWTAVDAGPLVCNGDDLVYNGSFEQGFNATAWGDVGRGWGAFTNGGAANYGFYQEQWDVVIADGHNGQLIEINTEAVYPTDADRYAGIYQRIDGLQPGKMYELILRGELRGEGNEEDPNRFAVQAALAAQSDWRHVDDDDWEVLEVGAIAVRTQPVPLAQVKVKFEAPAQTAFLYIRGWKKWAITNVEMDLNLDAIALRACESVGGGQPMGGTGGPTWATGPEGDACVYVVKPGDTLGYIADQYGISSAELVRANGIDDPDYIYVGQKFDIPGCGNQGMGMPMHEDLPGGPVMADDRADGPAREPQVGPETAMRERTYTVQGGDMLSYIAEQYGVNVYTLASYNGIDNMNFIYAGQVLHIPSNLN